MRVKTCINTGCTREAAYDSESDSYFSTCDTCHTHTAAGLHVHGVTSRYLAPVLSNGEVISWECREQMDDGTRCAYTVPATTVAARDKRQRAEQALVRAAYGPGRTDGWSQDAERKLKEYRAETARLFPVDVR